MITSIYKLRLQSTSVRDVWADGPHVVSYEGAIHLISGWENGPLSQKHYMSTDLGVTWSRLPDVPFAGRHTAGVGVRDGKIVIWGNDGAGQPYETCEYTTAGGWVKKVWAGTEYIDHPGLREHAAYCIHKGYQYTVGGHWLIDGVDTFFNDAWRTLNGANWEKVGDLPPAMHNWRSPCAVSFKGDIVWFGGGRQPAGTGVNTKVFKSPTDGATWFEIADVPMLNSFWWGDAVATDDLIFALSGSDINNSMTNNNRIVYTADCIDWKVMSKNIPGRHATGKCNHNGEPFFINGFGHNDCWRLQKIA